MRAASGSDIWNELIAKLFDELRNAPFGLPCTSLSSSMHMSAVAHAVLVAIAGMILPAIIFTLWRPASLMP